LNPKIKIIARTSYLRERETLTRCGADTVFAGEGEVALALAEFILRDLGATPEQMDREREKLRAGLLAGEIRTGGPSPL
jgi:monovalent cation:H+ antiporter-2, CPA2 family